MTIDELKAVGEFIHWLGESRAGPWWTSHAYRYKWFSSRPPYYHKCAYARKTKQIFERDEESALLEWLTTQEELVKEWKENG